MVLFLCHESYHMSFVTFLYALHGATSTKTITTNIDGNTYQNEMVAYLHVTWPNHAKVIKTAVPKAASQQATWSLITWYPDNWKEHVVTFRTIFTNKIWYEKTQDMMYLFFRFKIYMKNAASWNELKLLWG